MIKKQSLKDNISHLKRCSYSDENKYYENGKNSFVSRVTITNLGKLLLIIESS